MLDTLPKPLRCVFVTHGLSIGGAEKVLLSLLQSLDPSRYRAVVFSTGEGQELRGEYENACARLILRPKRCAFDVRLIPSLARIVNEEHAHIVISNLFYADIIAGMAKPFMSAPLISWQHAAPSTDMKNNRWYHYNAFRLVKQRFAKFVCCSKYLCDDLITSYRIRPDRLVTVHNWVDIEQFEFHEPGTTDDRFTIGNISRFNSGKGHEHLLRAFTKVRAEIPHADLVLVGDGPTRRHIQKMAVALGIETSTRFLGARFDVEDLLPKFDVFVLPSEVEAFPVCVLEAMSCGRPVIAYDIPGVRESITHGRTGLLSPVGDEDSLASCLIELGRNRALRIDLGRTARAEIESRFERKQQTEKFVRVVREVTQGT